MLMDLRLYRENLKYEAQIVMPIATRADLFGVPLPDIMGYNGEKGGVPRVVRDSILFLRTTGKLGALPIVLYSNAFAIR